MNCSAVAQEISRHICANVFSYYPQLEGEEIEVKLVEEQHRLFSSLYRFEIVSQLAHHKIFAKGIPQATNSKPATAATESRARLIPLSTDYKKRTWLEYKALKAIDNYFKKLDDPSFGAIHVLDFIHDPQTIIMEEYSEPSLRSLFAKKNRLNHLCGRSPPLLKEFFNAGAWLKAYSALPEAENVKTRQPCRDDFIASVIELTAYLQRVSGKASFFQRVEAIVITAANDAMPTSLPLGLGHGDYAMRNICVGADGRISAFDTCAKWKVPIYEDIAYFLVQLETNGLQVLSQGFAIQAKTSAAYEREFLAGYFGDANIPTKIVRLFQIQLLLDSWSSRITIYTKHHAGVKKTYNKFYLALLNRRYRIIMEHLLDEVSVQP